MTTVRELDVAVATPESIAPYGQLISARAAPGPLGLAFYEGSVRVYRPAEFISDDDTELTLASIDRRPLDVRWMERHFKHTQVFLPLGGKPFVAVLAPPTEGDLPRLDDVRAFLFDGTAGLSLHLGTWHEFPFALVDGTEVVVILRRETTRNLFPDAVADGEAIGPDLDKKDLVRRASTTFRIRV